MRVKNLNGIYSCSQCICYHTLGAPEEENWWVGLSFTLLFSFLSLPLFLFFRVVSWSGIMYEGCQKVSRIILGWNLLKFFILSQTSCHCHFESGDCNRTMVKLMFIENLLLCSDHFVHVNWLNPYNPVTLVLLLSGRAVSYYRAGAWTQSLWFQSLC